MHLTRKLFIASLFIAAGKVVAADQVDEPRFEVTPMLGYRAGGQFLDATNNHRNLNSRSALAVALNWRAAEANSQYELLYSRQATATEVSAIPMKVEYLQIGGTTVVGDTAARVVPFAAGGFGATRFSPGRAALSDETRWAVNLGGGVRIPLTPQVRLRFEVRGYLTWLEGKSELFCSSNCALLAKSKTFFQYEALGGVSFGF
jgi:hypothetical protein